MRPSAGPHSLLRKTHCLVLWLYYLVNTMKKSIYSSVVDQWPCPTKCLRKRCLCQESFKAKSQAIAFFNGILVKLRFCKSGFVVRHKSLLLTEGRKLEMFWIFWQPDIHDIHEIHIPRASLSWCLNCSQECRGQINEIQYFFIRLTFLWLLFWIFFKAIFSPFDLVLVFWMTLMKKRIFGF